MSDRGSLENLKQEIVENIYTNENQAVTGDLLQDVLIDAVDTMGVSVSQNNETGHTEIHIGSNNYPVPSIKDIYGSLLYNSSGVIAASGYRLILNNFPSQSEPKKGYAIVTGLSEGTITLSDSSWVGQSNTYFKEGQEVFIEIPESCPNLIITNKDNEEVSEATSVYIKVYEGGIKSETEENRSGVEQINDEITILNISQIYPKGGTDGTDIYTVTNARSKVPTNQRFAGLAIVYKVASDRIRFEQRTAPFANNTEWIYGKWDVLNLHDIQNNNEFTEHPAPYNDRKAGRNATPSFARKKGQVLMYKSVDGFHIEENINEDGSFNNNDNYFEPVIPQSLSLLKKPTILYESFPLLASGTTIKIIDDFTAVTKKTNAVVRICGVSGKFGVIDSNYQRIDELVDFSDGEAFVVKTYPNVAHLIITFDSLAEDTRAYILYCCGEENSSIEDNKDSIDSSLNNGYNKTWGVRSSLNIETLNTVQGKLNSSGVLVADSYQRMSLQYIPIKSGTFIQTIVTSWVYAIEIAFFKQKVDGSFEFVSYVDNDKVVFVPSGVTHVRFGFYIKYPQSTILTEEALEANYEVKLITNSNIGKSLEFENLFEKNPVLKISNYTDWILGIPKTYTETKMTHELPIKIIPGHRYRLEVPMDGTNITNAGWSFGETYDDLDQWKTWLDGTPLSGRNFFLDAPVNANYLRIQVTGGVALTPSEAENIILVDVTGKNPFESVDKIIDGWNHANSYAQGMTISNGYIFQAFADGYIDIYDVDTLALVQSVFAPTHEGVSVLHCNNLTFGEKYDVNDDFGVLYVNSDDANDPIVGIRVQLNDGVFTFTKVYEITPPEVDEDVYVGNDEIIDIYNKRLVEVLYATGYGDMTMRVYDYDNMDDSAEFTLQNTFTSAKLYPLQGGMLRDELLYLCVGSGGGNKACIYVFNIFSGEIVWILDLRKPKFGLNAGEEMQGVALYKNQLYFSTTYGLYIYSQG